MPEGGVMVFDATLNHISVISQRSFLLVEETRVPTKTTDIPQVTDKLYHMLLFRLNLDMRRLTTV